MDGWMVETGEAATELVTERGPDRGAGKARVGGPVEHHQLLRVYPNLCDCVRARFCCMSRRDILSLQQSAYCARFNS